MEMIRSGATCVVDYVYELAGWTEESIGAVARAYRDLGLRAVIVIGMSDRSYDEVGRPRPRPRLAASCASASGREKPPPWPEWEAFARFAVERYHRPEEGISIGLGPSGPQRCTDEMLSACAALADELDLTIHIHVLETRMQALSGMKMYGKTLPAHMNEIGFLGPRVSFEHGIWLTEADIDLVAQTRTSITHNPISNMKLGSGIAAIPVLLDAGVNVAMGSDGMSSNDGNDLLRDAQGRRAPAQALGRRLRAVARAARGVADGDARRCAGGRRRRARDDRARQARRPRSARSREPRLHAAERPAPARRLLLDDERRRLDHGRRPLGAAGRQA